MVDDDGNPILDADGNTQTATAKRSAEFSEIFTTAADKVLGITRKVYVSAWNMFQDSKIHFRAGTPIRYETIDIFDDVELVNPALTGAAKYKDDNMQSYGKTFENSGGKQENNGKVKNPTANGSSVQKTDASSNGIKLKDENGKEYLPYTYNTAGNPYVWQDLDSIDVDFQAEVGWQATSIYPLQDWDLQFGYDKPGDKYVDGSGNSNVGVGAVKHHKYNQDGSEKKRRKKAAGQTTCAYTRRLISKLRTLSARLTLKAMTPTPTFCG